MDVNLDKLSKYILIFIGLISSSIFIYNILNYYSYQGPDGEAHSEYIYFLSIYLPDSLKLPSIGDTYEYFSPPIAYIFPALSQVLCRNLIESEDYKTDCIDFYDNLGQLFLFTIFLVYLYVLMKISQRLFKDYLKFFIPLLILTLSLSVNYQMFSYFRGESYILLFSSIVFLLLLKIFQSSNIKILDYLYIGILIGLLLLSRQWAVFFLPTILFFWILNKSSKSNKKKMFFMFSMAALVGFIIAAPFYISLQEKEDSIAAWNGDSYEINLNRYPSSFFYKTGFSEGLFSNPTISNDEYSKKIHGESIFPTFLSTIWGDPNGYFSYTHLRNIERNENFEKYLGFVNVIGIFLILLSSLGVYKFIKIDKTDIVNNSEIIYLRLIIFNFLSTFLLYIFWMYLYLPSINANYMLQITNLFPFFGAYAIYKIRNRNYYVISIVSLFIVYIFLIPTYIYGSSYLFN